MNKEKQRIAIAEACGWKDIKDTNHEDVDIESRSISCWSGLTGVPPKFIHYEWNRVIIPDYLNDLNAMHEAEKVLTIDQLIDQAAWLGASSDEMMIKSWVILLRANAAQRAEAFLRTIGKWEDDK